MAEFTEHTQQQPSGEPRPETLKGNGNAAGTSRTASGLTAASERFLATIFGAKARDATTEWWRFNAKGKPTGRQTARAAAAAPGRYDAVYWSVGMMKDGTGRANTNVVAVHALVADDVGTKVAKDLVDRLCRQPTGIIETSPGNYQYVWGCPEGMTVAQFQRIWAGMVRLLGKRTMDGSDQSHLFRLPEGMNGKPGKVWRVVQVGALGPVYTAAELEAAFPGGVGARSPHQGSSAGGQKATVEQVRGALAVLPNDGEGVWCADRKAWIDMGMAIKGALGDEGLELWEKWCDAQDQGEDILDVWEGRCRKAVAAR